MARVKTPNILAEFAYEGLSKTKLTSPEESACASLSLNEIILDVVL